MVQGKNAYDKRASSAYPIPMPGGDIGELPVIRSDMHVYAGPDGGHVLGFMEPRNLIRLHPGVIGRIAYQLGIRPEDLEKETLEHERMHEINPYASESANRAAVAHARASRGAPVSPLHAPYMN